MKSVNIIAIVGLSLFTSDIIFANEYKTLIQKVKNDKILSIEAKEYDCYQYWKNSKTKYDCIKDFCNTIQINSVQGQETICKTIATKIKLKQLNNKELFYTEIKDLDIYNIEKVKQYFSPTILPCVLNEECDSLLQAEEKGFNIVQYNQNIKIEFLSKDNIHRENLSIVSEYYYDINKPEFGTDGWQTWIHFIRNGYLEPYGNGILIDKSDHVINGTLAYYDSYFCRFEEFNKIKLLKCYKL